MNSPADSEMPAPSRQSQISLKGILWAAYWVAVCVVAWRARYRWSGLDNWWFQFAATSFRFFPVPTAIGALLGHPWRGAAIGIALYVGLSFLLTFLVHLYFWAHSP